MSQVTKVLNTERKLQKLLTKIARVYCKARYNREGVANAKKVYLTLTVIGMKESGTDKNLVSCYLNNEYNEQIGEGLDVSFPINKYWKVKINGKNRNR